MNTIRKSNPAWITATRTLVAVVLAFAMPGCSSSGSGDENYVEEYPVITVNTDSVTVNQIFTANIQGQQDVEIMPQVSGTIKKECVTEGQKVVKGQTLFVIDPVPYEAAYAQAVANVHAAQAALSSAELERENQQILFDEKVIGKYELQRAENSLLQAKAALEQAKAVERETANNLSYTNVTSPANGVVGTLPYRVGALVGPQIPKPLTTVSDCSSMWVYFSLSEKALRLMQQPYGSRRAMLEAMPEVQLQLSDGTLYPIKGRIESISGVVNPTTGSVQLRAVFPNPDGELLSGSVGDVLIPQKFNDAIIIPMSATYELQDHVYVSMIVDGKVKKQRIQVNRISDSRNYIVTEGLKVGDVIIAQGAGMTREGDEVAIKRSHPEGETQEGE